ncbi:PREDICTED: TMV resistance protein N-like isoform X1 [Nicotiana attenuata]|uniref:Tmv resistance protein n n=2 Tax=Nicotiana attenuata TaxID=49451 RepID=A0A1J6JYL7_NICAT|nr:PREDICTED: TMV resistance protein N-like isoform X1 [Nicotiana attenuata]OIT22858.1 tmv resistance protein n [Nicotiana attenuata]
MADQKGKDQSSNSQPSLALLPWKYDVFLNCSGGDTSKYFVDQLYLTLRQAGFNTFRTDDEGEHVSSEVVMNAIEGSIIFIIVLSKNYASSRRCLNELVHILEVKKNSKRLILPIFYDIDPSDARKQTGIFAEAFERHGTCSQSEQNIQLWRAALSRVGNLSGWDLRHVAEGFESKFIHIISEEVLQEVKSRTPLYVTKHPVALFPRVNQIEKLLFKGRCDDVRVIGIYGMGGIGKTTLAKAVFNQVLQHFEASCFLENVKSEASESPNGLVHLQEQLLRTILRRKIKVHNVDEGITLIKEGIWQKKVFIVLDDLDDQCQLNALLGERDWLRPGSRVVITTQDKHLLKELQMNEQYEAMKLDHKSSLQLFTLHAFRNAPPAEDYSMHVDGIVTYCAGVPLALQVLGAYLSDKKIEEWKNALDKLKTIPSSDIHTKLRIIFDGLPDDFTKAVFLDLACFFFKIQKSEVVGIFTACGFYPEVEICELIDKSLLTIDENKHLNMHNLIRDMGREIVHSESPDNPGKRSRLWCPKDISDVLIGHKGTKAVEGIVLESSALKDVPFSTKAFEKMAKLRLLHINHLQLYGRFQYLPKSLKYLHWHYCPLKCLPSDLCLENLVILNMSFGKFKESQAPLKYFKCLKSLVFYSCEDLKKSPEFVGLHSLEELSFGYCSNLMGLDSTIGELKRLRILNIADCKNLRELPRRICELKSLEILYLYRCSKLEELPDDLGKLERLKELNAVATAITRLPGSVGHLKNLEMLLLSQDFLLKRQSKFSDIFSTWLQPKRSHSRVGYLPSSFSSLSALKVLQIENWNMTEDDIPFSLASLSSLQNLCFSNNKFHAIHFNLCDLSSLKYLNLSECPNLKSIPEIPPTLQNLRAYKCKSLERLPNLSGLKRLEELELYCCEMLTEIQGLENLDSVRRISLWSCKSFGRLLDVSNLSKLKNLDLSHCERLIEIRGLENLHSIRYINLFNCKALKNPFTENFFKAHYEHGSELQLGLCNSNVPNWFSYKVDGCSMCFNMPLQGESTFLGMFLWVVYGTVDETKNVYPKATIVDQTNGVEFNHRLWTTISFAENSSIHYIPRIYFKCPVKGREMMSIHIECYDFPTEDFVKKCGVHLLYKDKNGQVHSVCEFFS